MKFGVCAGNIETGMAAVHAGFDYVEFGAGFVESEAAAIRQAGLPTPRTNLFFPSDVRLFVDPTPYLDVATVRIKAAATLGVSVMVLGSGNARRAPDSHSADWDREFVTIVSAIQSIATDYGIRIAPESLNGTETNVGVKLERLSKLLVEAGLDFTADSYHLLAENEDFSRAIPVAPAHVHIANRSRMAPSTADIELTPFVDRLRECGFDGTVSIEGKIEDLNAANNDLRELFER